MNPSILSKIAWTWCSVEMCMSLFISSYWLKSCILLYFQWITYISVCTSHKVIVWLYKSYGLFFMVLLSFLKLKPYIMLQITLIHLSFLSWKYWLTNLSCFSWNFVTFYHLRSWKCLQRHIVECVYKISISIMMFVG